MDETYKNSQLKAVMDEANMSSKGLASRIKALSEQRGDDPPARPDHNRVRRWFRDGEVPKFQTQRYIAEALRSKLGREVTLSEIGFPSGPADDEGEPVDIAEDGARYPESAETSIQILTRLAAADQQDGQIGPDWNSDTTATTITGYLFAQPLVVAEPLDSYGDGIAAPIRATTASFMQLDFQYGGGHLRNMLLTFFQGNVLPTLKQPHPDATRRELFSAAAEVAQLLGWTSYDVGRHNAASRYLKQGLRLAREAGDHMLGGRLFANLSHQANYLGKFKEATEYARAAQHATRGIATPAVETLYLAHEARALASVGESSLCASVMDRAETLLDKGKPGSEPAWASYVDAPEIAGEWAHVFRDLGQPDRALSFVETAVQGTPTRTQAFLRMVSAASTLQAGDSDAAVSIAHQAVDLAGPLNSARYHRYLTDFRDDLVQRHGEGDARVRSFAATLRERYPQLHVPDPRSAR